MQWPLSLSPTDQGPGGAGRRRRSSRSDRAYAVSVWFRTTLRRHRFDCLARAVRASDTSSRSDEQKPCGTAPAFRSWSKPESVARCGTTCPTGSETPPGWRDPGRAR